MMNGTPAIPAYYAALPGLEIIQQVGVDRIRDGVAGDDTAPARPAWTSTATVRSPRAIPSASPARWRSTCRTPRAWRTTLNARDFVVDYRPGVGIRLSPHFYNTMDEIDAMMSEIDRIVRTRDFAPGT